MMFSNLNNLAMSTNDIIYTIDSLTGTFKAVLPAGGSSCIRIQNSAPYVHSMRPSEGFSSSEKVLASIASGYCTC